METQVPVDAPKADIRSLVLQLKYSRRLPSLPAVAVRLLERAEDAAATLGEFERLIQQDPALAGKLLRVANSSFYGRTCEVASVPQALRILGLNATVALALSFSLREIPVHDGAPEFDAADYWRRSILTGIAAHAIAGELGEQHPENFLLAGLLREIGVLALLAVFGDRYLGLGPAGASHEDRRGQERAAFGFDHVDAGTCLLENWRLPRLLVDSIVSSHATGYPVGLHPGDVSMLPACVATAAHLVDDWLAPSPAAPLVAAGDPVGSALGLSDGQFRRVAAAIGRRIPEVEALFRVKLADPAVLRSLEEAAQEVAEIRDVRQASAPPAAVARARALEEQVATLEEQTQRDALTGLYNRAHLERVLADEFARATRERRPLSVVFVDLDRFKAVNDTFGHQVGDQVLIATARRLQASARQSDTVVRYGGEEFVLLLACTRAREAVMVMRRLLAAVSEPPFHTRDGASGTVTFSAGIATHMESDSVFESPEALVAAADQALYHAKHQGRSRIVVYEMPVDIS